MKMRGGLIRPEAISSDAEQLAIICATSIFPTAVASPAVACRCARSPHQLPLAGIDSSYFPQDSLLIVDNNSIKADGDSSKNFCDESVQLGRFCPDAHLRQSRGKRVADGGTTPATGYARNPARDEPSPFPSGSFGSHQLHRSQQPVDRSAADQR